jgi:hypothetical protein
VVQTFSTLGRCGFQQSFCFSHWRWVKICNQNFGYPVRFSCFLELSVCLVFKSLDFWA